MNFIYKWISAGCSSQPWVITLKGLTTILMNKMSGIFYSSDPLLNSSKIPLMLSVTSFSKGFILSFALLT